MEYLSKSFVDPINMFARTIEAVIAGLGVEFELILRAMA